VKRIGVILMITKEDVIHVSKLARINLTEEEVKKFEVDLNAILDAFKSLDSVDTEGVEPAFHPIDIRNGLREDVESRVCDAQELLESSAEKEDGYIKGPRVV